MTREEWGQAYNWIQKTKPSDYVRQLVHVFGSYEMGKPRPEGTWLERFEKWRKETKDGRQEGC